MSVLLRLKKQLVTFNHPFLTLTMIVPPSIPTSYEAFRLLPLEQQRLLIWVEGIYLGQRWEGNETVGLYHMTGGFFAKVYYDVENNSILNVDSFTSSTLPEDYSPGIDLGDLTP